ncbi:MAG: hypothetical protein V4481_05750 [Patescibacteria group bacterium]
MAPSAEIDKADSTATYEVVRKSLVTKPIELKNIITREGTGKLMSEESGAGQLVHPSIVMLEKSWMGSKCWLAADPYPYGNSSHENPTLYQCKDSITLIEPLGLKNPLLPTPSTGYNSDVNLVYDESAKGLFMSNRVVRMDSNLVRGAESVDGKAFGSQQSVVSGMSHTLISQSVTYGPDGVPKLYTVNSGGAGCSAKSTRVEVWRPMNFVAGIRLKDVVWDLPAEAKIVQPGYVVWHEEVRWIPSLHLYLAIFAAYPEKSGGCGNDDLFLATSEDGLSFTTYPVPLMWRDNPWMPVTSVYKSTFVYDEARGLLLVWPSVLKKVVHLKGGDWRLWYMAYKWSPLITGLNTELRVNGFSRVAYRRLLIPDTSREKQLKGLIMP